MFSMGTPRAYGGGELDPMSQVRVVEELARIEGSVGWLSMISSRAASSQHSLNPQRRSVFSAQSTASLPDRLRPPQRADLVEGGYRLSGTYHFGSGCQHASVITCGCNIYENGELRRHGRHPEFRVMLVPASKVTIVDVWDTTGMRGTGSNDIVFDNVFVPFGDSTTMADKPHVRGPALSISTAVSGFARRRSARNRAQRARLRRGADRAEEMDAKRPAMREDPTVQETIAWARLNSARRAVTFTHAGRFVGDAMQRRQAVTETTRRISNDDDLLASGGEATHLDAVRYRGDQLDLSIEQARS